MDAATPWVDVYTSPWGFYNGEFSTPESLQLLTATPYLVKVRVKTTWLLHVCLRAHEVTHSLSTLPTGSCR